jgi:signal transduction histidine kinase
MRTRRHNGPMADGIGRRTIASLHGVAQGPHLGPLLALVLGLGSLIEAFAYAKPSDRPTAMVANLAVTMPLAVAFRWRLWAAVAVTALMMVTLSGAVVMTASAVTAQLIVLFLVAEGYGRLVSIPFAVPYLLNALFNWSGGDPGVSGLFLFVLVVATLALGDVWRLRRQAMAERDESRREVADSLKERVAMEERARIARELHDVVAHHVSKIAVQAESARLTTPRMSEQERERFEDIAETARDALGEMRRLLGILREDAGGGGEREPQPGLGQLQELLDEARSMGTLVRFELSGQVAALPAAVDLTAYRIVQEALTNARRHAPGANVEIDLRYEPTLLRIRVRDDGPGPAAEANGHGLQGMRERAAMVGGMVRTGPAEGGGFVIEAELPRGSGAGGT